MKNLLNRIQTHEDTCNIAWRGGKGVRHTYTALELVTTQYTTLMTNMQGDREHLILQYSRAHATWREAYAEKIRNIDDLILHLALYRAVYMGLRAVGTASEIAMQLLSDIRLLKQARASFEMLIIQGEDAFEVTMNPKYLHAADMYRNLVADINELLVYIA